MQRADNYLTDSSPTSRLFPSLCRNLVCFATVMALFAQMGCGGGESSDKTSEQKSKSQKSPKVADGKDTLESNSSSAGKSANKPARAPLSVDRTGSSAKAKKKDSQSEKTSKSNGAANGNQETKPSVPTSFSTLQEARKFGWEAATLIATSLQPETSSQTFEGMKAWKTDFEILQGKVNLKKLSTLDKIDVDKLITSNPNFWRMFYEVTPGDPAMAFMLAGFFLASGDANRASAVVHVFRHHRGNEVKSEFDLLQATAMDVIKEGNKQLADGRELLGKEQFQAAEREFLKATKLWPKNGIAWLEAARANDKHRAELGDAVPSNAYKEHLANARRYLPFEMEAYQGDEKVFKLLQAAIAGSEAWTTIIGAKNGLEDGHLATMVDACSQLGTIDLALFAQQVLIARRGRYTQDDAILIEGMLDKVAPDHPTVETVKRLKSIPVSFYVLSKGPPPKSAGNAIALPSKFAPRTRGVKLEALQVLTDQKVFFEQLEVRRFGAFQKSLEEAIYQILGDSELSYKLRIQITMHIPRRAHLVRITHRGKVPKDTVETLEKKLQSVSTIYTRDATVEYALFVDVRAVTKDEGKN